MQYTISRGEKGKIDIKVDIPKATFEQNYNLVLARLAVETEVAGFRPGKVPPEVVQSRIGVNKVLNETASFLISKHLSEILKKEDVVPLDSPKIAIQTLSQGLPFAFNVSFTQKPKVTIGDWKKIKVAKVKAQEVLEKDVEESIKNIFEAWKKQKSATTEGTEKDSEDTENKNKKYIYDAHGNKIFLKDEESINEDKGSLSTNAQDKINDDFARAIGANDLSHLREIVKKDLETIVADSAEVKFEQEIFEKMMEMASIDIPDILVEDELNRMLVRLASELERQNKKLDDWMLQQKTNLDELKKKWRAQAERNAKISLILDEIGRSEKVQVAKEEVDKALAGVNETNLSEDQKRDLEKYIVFSIFQAKTLDLVKKTVTI